MKKITTLFLMLLVALTLSSCGGSSDVESTEISKEVISESQEETDNIISVDVSTMESQTDSSEVSQLASEETINELSMIEMFVEGYNATAPTTITDLVEFDVPNQDSGHYRTEFRLGAFQEADGQTGKIGDIIIDIVRCGIYEDELRIYADDITSEQAAEIVKYAAPVMDPNVTADELQDVLDYLNGITDYHNGYFGNLCMTFNKIHGQLMLRTD